MFKKKTRDEWIKSLNEKGGGIAYSIVNEPKDLQSDPQILENDYIMETEHPVLGKTKVIGCPIKFSQTAAEPGSYAPNFGQNTEEVLLELCNYSWEDIEKLKDEEVI